MADDPADRYQEWRDFHEDLGRHGLGRIWERVVPHPKHDRCWEEQDIGSSSALHTVCVTRDPSGRYDITSRRTGGTRVLAHCHSGQKEGQLPVKLRAVFDKL
jgi:hypothetical protein